MEAINQQLELLCVIQGGKIFSFMRYAILKYYKNNFCIRVYSNIYVLIINI